MLSFLFVFNYHIRFFPSYHRSINIRKDILKGKVKRDVTPTILLSGESYDEVSKHEDIILVFIQGGKNSLVLV
jgi:hypothetical protein